MIRTTMESVGFTFHSNESGMHWYCWCGPEGRWDVESGPEYISEREAVASAAAKYVAFNEGIRIAIREHTGMIDGEYLDADGKPDPNAYEGGEDDANYSEDLTWFEVLRLCNEGATDRILPPKPTDPAGVVRAALRDTRDALCIIENSVAYGGDESVAEAIDACTNALAVLPYLTTIGGERR